MGVTIVKSYKVTTLSPTCGDQHLEMTHRDVLQCQPDDLIIPLPHFPPARAARLDELPGRPRLWQRNVRGHM